jgi:GAF domain-containing protein
VILRAVVERPLEMPTRLWRILALTGMIGALCIAVLDVLNPVTFAADNVVADSVDGHTAMLLRVTSVSGTNAQNGGIQPGDVIVPHGTYGLRWRQNADPPGTTHVWLVQRGAQRPFLTKTSVTREPPRQLIIDAIVHFVRFAMILMAMLVAFRRPEVAAARALATFLAVVALTMYTGAAWLSDSLYAGWVLIRGPLQTYGLSQGLLFATIFPFASLTGVRLWLRRAIIPYTILAAAGAYVIDSSVSATGDLPQWGLFGDTIEWMPIGYFLLIFVAFGVALRQASGSDRVRIYWASGSICVGFIGPIVQTIIIVVFHNTSTLDGLLSLTLVAVPLGLAYTILRHRTVDIGFVISRALVLTILSFILVAAFGLLERALGKIFIDASHVASRSVEIALALGLGFSLRPLHARIEGIVDSIFFRTRRRALATLKSFSDDVYHITDPDVAIERTVAVTSACSDAENAALYLIAHRRFGCAVAVVETTLPSELDENDPLLVRLRASRRPELLRGLGSAIDAEIAFPMFVRGTLVGALVLAPKRSGEAYDPEETTLITDLVQRVGLALDALQTLALRRELAAAR